MKTMIRFLAGLAMALCCNAASAQNVPAPVQTGVFGTIGCPSASLTPCFIPNSPPNGMVPLYNSATTESCAVAKASAGILTSWMVTTSVAGFVMLFNTVVPPVDGAVVPFMTSVQVPVGTSALSFIPGPFVYMATGVTICLSSNASPFTKTASATAAFTVWGK